jgi:thioredoxin 1
MSIGLVRSLTDETIAEAERAGVTAVVEFRASWCMPCRMMDPVVRQVSHEFSGSVLVGQVDTDENRRSAERFGISAVPTTLVLRDGAVVGRFVGVTGYDRIAGALDDALGRSGV